MKEPTVRQNVIANFAGKAWTSLMSLIFVPFYLKMMGIEAYGLIGIFVSLLTLFTILDMGLSSTLSRQLAQLDSAANSEQESKDLVRTLESVYWGVGILIGLILVAAAPVLADHWIKTEGISSTTVKHAIRMMGLIIAVQWPVSLYEGGLIGLQQQVLLNWVRTVSATLQHAGAVLVLWLVSPTIIAYFSWQIFIGAVQVIFLAYFLWKSLPRTNRKGVFRKSLLKKNWRFAAGMMSISIMSVVLTQSDKIVLSRMLPLAVFGYYTLAFNLANSLTLLVNPVFTALFPKLSQLIIKKDGEQLISDYYHKGCQVVSIIVLPAACILVLFSYQILGLWVQDPFIAEKAYTLLSLLAIGSCLNSLMTIPFTLQLAYGWTKLSFLKNVIAVIFLVPLMILFVNFFGAKGAAFVWIILNVGYFFIEIPVMHSRLLKRDMWRWYFNDVTVPLFVILSIVAFSRIMIPATTSKSFALAWILSTAVLAFASPALVVPFTRNMIKRSIA